MQISLWCQIQNRPMPSLARSCTRWWPDFVIFTANTNLSLRRGSSVLIGGALEGLFCPEGREFEQANLRKFKCPGVARGGDVELSNWSAHKVPFSHQASWYPRVSPDDRSLTENLRTLGTRLVCQKKISFLYTWLLPFLAVRSALQLVFLFYSTLLILIYTKIRLHLATVCPSGPCIELPDLVYYIRPLTIDRRSLIQTEAFSSSKFHPIRAK